MSNELKQQYLMRVRSRYFKSSRRQKTLIIDEFCQVCDISRKHAIKLLNEDMQNRPKRPGPKPLYGPDIHEHIKEIYLSPLRFCQ